MFYSADKIYRAALNLGSTAIQASYVFTISNKRDWILMVDYQRAAGRVGCSPREVIGERRLSYRLAAERARIRSLAPNHGGRPTRFHADQTPWNKGIPYDAGGRSRETRFRPGQRQGRALALWQPVGSLRINADGYLQRKINDDKPYYKRWRAEHLIVWEAAHGPLPKGHAVIFRDGDKMNVSARDI